MNTRKLKEIMEREKEHHLALWCMEQAKLYHEGKLSKDKVKKLKARNFPFDYYLALHNRYDMTFEEFEKDKSVGGTTGKVFTLQVWVSKDKGRSEWKTEIVLTGKQFDKIDEIVKKAPNKSLRLLDEHMRVIAIKLGNYKTRKGKNLNFRKG